MPFGLLRALARSLTVMLTCAAVPLASAQDYYKGKTITVHVGLAPGGTVDTMTRLFAAVWERQIPGNPTIIVKSMPGGGGLNATSYVHEVAARDGLSLYLGPWIPIGQILGQEGIRFRYENFAFLGGLGDTRVAYARTDIVPGGLKSPADIARARDFYVGGNSATGAAHLSGRLPLDVLGLPYKEVVGFRGGSDIFLAMQRGEIHYSATSIGTFRTRNAEFARSGQGMALFYLVPMAPDGTYERSRFIPEMPAFPDLYREIHGRLPSGPIWQALDWFTRMSITLTYVALAPPGTPPRAIADLRTGFARMIEDPELNKEGLRLNGFPWEWVDADRGGQIIKSLADTPPAVVATLRELLEKGGRDAIRRKP